MSTRLVIFAAITLAGALILTACGGERAGDVPVGGAAGQPPEKATNTPWEHLASPTSTPVKTNASDPPPPTNTPAPGATSAPPTATRPPAPSFTLTVTSPVAHGGNATATGQTSPNASCTISYTTPAGTDSTAAGLIPKIAGADGSVTWTWIIASATKPGTGTIRATCAGQTVTQPIVIT
jgi:hypothetical protein